MSISYGGDNIQDTDGGVLRPISSVMRNRIINGAMVIDQRNAGASVSASDGTYGVDRFAMYYQTGIASKGTIQQNAGSVTPPVGFANYLGFTSNSAYSVAIGDAILINQRIEGYNIADLNWGTANAKTVTLSFWVYSSLTGTFGGTLRNAAGTQYYPYSYTVSSANTWQQISVTIAGSTTGTWGSTNGIGVYVMFGLGVGSSLQGTANTWSASAYFSPTGATSVVGTSGATFYITGVQLEVGSSATGFEYRQYGTELALCQRYYQTFGGAGAYERTGVASAYSTTNAVAIINMLVQMRTTPTLGYSAVGDWLAGLPGVANSTVTALSIDSAASSSRISTLDITYGSNANFGSSKCVLLTANGTTNARLTFNAEL